MILTGTAAKDAGSMRDRLSLVVSSACARPDEMPVEIRFAVAEAQEDEAPADIVEMAGLAMTAAKMDPTS